MIISNVNIKSTEVKMDFGTIHQIVLGEKGRGRKEMRLTCPENSVIERGSNFLSIGMTKSNRPRIVNGDNGKLYLLISTEGGYTRRGNGWVGSWRGNTCTFNVLARGNGADGDAGRIGSWDVLLIEVQGEPKNEWLRIRTGGGGYGVPPQWLHIDAKGIALLFDSEESALIYCDEVGMEPFEAFTQEDVDEKYIQL